MEAMKHEDQSGKHHVTDTDAAFLGRLAEAMKKQKIITRPISSLTAYEQNARQHSQAQIDQIKASILEFGWTNPVLIDEEGGLIAGHGRIEAATKLGLTEVPTITLNDLTEAQKKALIIADNKIALNAAWDFEILATELRSLEALGYENFNFVGFTADELTALYTGFDKDAPAEFKEVDENVETQHRCPKCGYEYSGGKPPMINDDE